MANIQFVERRGKMENQEHMYCRFCLFTNYFSIKNLLLAVRLHFHQQTKTLFLDISFLQMSIELNFGNGVKFTVATTNQEEFLHTNNCFLQPCCSPRIWQLLICTLPVSLSMRHTQTLLIPPPPHVIFRPWYHAQLWGISSPKYLRLYGI